MESEKRTWMVLVTLLAVCVCTSLAQAQLSGFTYQGELNFRGEPVTDNGDLHFMLYTSSIHGTMVYETWAIGVDFVEGKFNAYVDFGPGVFDGTTYWMEIEVSVPKGSPAVTLGTRQPITPAPFALYALDCASGGGDSPWNPTTGGIYYSDGKVGVGTSSPNSRLHVIESSTYAVTGQCEGENTIGHLGSEYAGVHGEGYYGVYGATTNINGYGVHGYGDTLTGTARGVVGETRTPDGAGVFGKNTATTGPAIAVHGVTSSTEGFGGYFEGKGFFENYLGIGTDDPDQMLHVAGTAKMSAIQIGESATPGHVLTANASGFGTWQAPPTGGGETVWETDGTDAWYTTGDVGIGTSSPSYPLEVTTSSSRTAYVTNTQATGTAYGLYASTSGTGGRAIYGTSTATTGTTYGLYGRSSSSSGRGVYGYNSNGGYGVYGSCSTGWGGYFYGKGYFSGDVGIGTTSPTEKLDVNGTVRMNGFQLDGGASAGYVLTCDSSGVGTWQESTGGSGFSLPYDGTVSSSTAAFKVTNTGSGMSSHAISAKLDNPSSDSDAAAGYFSATGSNGMGIYVTSDGTSIRGYSSSSTGTAVYGSSAGNGARFSSSGTNCYGVKGSAGAISGNETYGGWFETNSSSGSGVYAHVTGDYAEAVKAVAEGGEGVAIWAEAPWYAIYAKSPSSAGRFSGDVRVYEYNTSNLVFHVDGSEGTTKVDILEIMGGSDLAENFDVTDREAEPGTVVEIDPDNPGKLRIAKGQYNRRVAGVVSGANGVDVGMVLADLPGSTNSQPVALSGRVWVKCDASLQAVQPGDMLTTSDKAGYAMPVTDFTRAHGAVIGKAMSKLEKGQTGMVLVLVNLQ